MDSKSKTPDIRTEVNRETKRDKKKAGFLASLFGGGAEGGAGLSGGVVDIGGAAMGGGLLATKAGLVAMILAGSTVAAGVGLVGYRVFGPNASSDGSENNFALFAPRPKKASTAAAPAPGSENGTSPSLNMLNQANSVGASGSASGGAAAAPADQVAGAASSGGAANSADGGTAMSDSAGGAHGPMPNIAKFGPLGASTGGGGGAAVSSAIPGSGQPHGGEVASASSKGNLSGMAGKLGAGARAAAMSRSFSRGGSGAVGQAFSAMGDQARGTAASSYAAGRTYDGSAGVGGSSIGPSAGLPSIPGGGPGAQAAATSMPNAANQNGSQIQPPPTPAAVNVTPWQGDINAAEMLTGIAIALILLKKTIVGGFLKQGALTMNPEAKAAAMVISAIITAIGLAVIALGARISGGPYGQLLQGRCLAAAGLGLIIAGAGMFVSDSGITDSTSTESQGLASNSSFMSGMSMYVIVGGGLSLLTLAGAALSPKQSYPSTDFNNGIAPGQGWFSMNGFPSEQAVRRLS